MRGNGDLELALTIRTFAVAEGRIHLWVGGGIVWDSDPEAEIEESWTRRGRYSPRSERRSRRWRTDASGRRRLGPRCRRPGRTGLRADDEALLRGRGVFETLRVYGGRPFRFEEHLARIGLRPAIGLPVVDAAQLKDLAGEALVAAGAPDAVLRLFWTPSPPRSRSW